MLNGEICGAGALAFLVKGRVAGSDLEHVTRCALRRISRQTDQARVRRLTLMGVGAMDSPRFAPAGLLVECELNRVMLDGGPGAEPPPPLEAWLVNDQQAELRREIRRLAAAARLAPAARPFESGPLSFVPRPVTHASHSTFAFEIVVDTTRLVWALEFWVFPSWTEGADLMFADAAGWRRPIRFRGGVGGHAAALDVCEQARLSGVRRLVLAHVGRPTLRAIDRGEQPPFGEFGADGATYVLPRPTMRVLGPLYRGGHGPRFTAWIRPRHHSRSCSPPRR